MQDEVIKNIRTIDLVDEVVVLDPARLSFNDSTLSLFMEELSIWYDYFSSKTAKAEELYVNIESEKEMKYYEHFLKAKTDGLPDKAAEAYARTQLEVKQLQVSENKLSSALKQLKEFTKSLDKAHSMAQNRGYMIRKEMDKLNSDIYQSSNSSNSNFQKSLEDIIGG